MVGVTLKKYSTLAGPESARLICPWDTALSGFFHLPLVRCNKSFLCNPSQIRNKIPSLNPSWPKLASFWTFPYCIECFASAPYFTRRVVTFVKWTGLAWRLRGTCVVSHKSPKRI